LRVGKGDKRNPVETRSADELGQAPMDGEESYDTIVVDGEVSL